MAFVEIIGYTAAFCTTLAFLPQVIKVLRTRDTSSLSLLMYIVFNMGVMLWFCYGLLRHDPVIILANLVTLGLSLTILSVKIKNDLLARKLSSLH